MLNLRKVSTYFIEYSLFSYGYVMYQMNGSVGISYYHQHSARNWKARVWDGGHQWGGTDARHWGGNKAVVWLVAHNRPRPLVLLELLVYDMAKTGKSHGQEDDNTEMKTENTESRYTASLSYNFCILSWIFAVLQKTRGNYDHVHIKIYK